MKKAAKLTYIWQRALMVIMFVIGVLGMIFNEDQSAKAEYLFICVQSGLFLIISLVPFVLNKMQIDVPDFIYIFFICFCLAHFFCGEILGFYVRFKWWDVMLHTISGVMLALLSFSLINLLNDEDGSFKLSMGFSILFAFSLAVTIGVLWEVVEFIIDCWFGSNMQRAYVSTHDGRGAPFIGQKALLDTMKDLILDSIGAAITCVTCGFLARKKKLKNDDFSFIKKRKKFNPVSLEADTKNVDVLTYDAVVEEVNTNENLIAKELIALEEKEKKQAEKNSEEKQEDEKKPVQPVQEEKKVKTKKSPSKKVKVAASKTGKSNKK